MKEWFEFAKLISGIIFSLLAMAIFLDCFPVINTFFILSFMTFIFSLTTIFTLIVKKNGFFYILCNLYIDVRRKAIKIVSNIYNVSVPLSIIKDGEEKMSKRLRKIRECILYSYISSWWSYLSPNNNFEMICRQKISKILEILAERFKVLNYSQLILTVIQLKVGMARSRNSNLLKRLSEVDQEKYFSAALFEIMPKLLEEEEFKIIELREFLSEMLSISVLIPLLDLVQSPTIIFNSVIAILVSNQDDIAEYVAKCHHMRLNSQTTTKEGPTGEILFGDDKICSPLSNTSPSNTNSINNLKIIDQSEQPKLQLVHSISNITIINTIRNTDVKSGNQYTVYIIKLTCTMTSSLHHLSTVHRTTPRRYREFVNLHHALSDLADYKGIRGPSSLDQMLLHNFSPARINVRKDFLENYLKNIVARPTLLGNENLQRFLGICQSSPERPFENIVTPLNEKIKKKWNLLMDKITDKFPDSSKEIPSDREDVVSDRDENRNSNVEPYDSQDEINKLLSSLSKLTCHQNPAFPTRIPEFENQHSLIQANYRHLTDNFMLMSHSLKTATVFNYTKPTEASNEATPSNISIRDPLSSPSHRFPINYKSGPIQYGPNDPVPFLLSFRLLAMQYRNQTCHNWAPHEGPVLTRTGGLLAKCEKLFWQILGCPADAIIQWSFEDLLRASYVSDYLELFQELLWPSGKSSKSLATFAMNADPVQLQQAATQSIVDALPKITYLFVNKDDLTHLIDAVLSDFQDPQSNRLFLFQLMQIIIEEHLFRDVFNTAKL